MNKTIKYRKVTHVITAAFTLILTLCACSAGDSGLYHVQAYEAGSDKTVPDPVSPDESPAQAYDPADSDPDLADGTRETEDASDDPKESSVTGAPEVIYVHVCGEVRSPGVYELNLGDRVFDAVDAAGGFTEDADEAYINLAMAVSDGMKIRIPDIRETADMPGEQETIVIPEGSADTATSGDAHSKDNTRININTADAATLMTISGIGQTRADAIITYREQNGGFKSVEDIKNVSGIGDATYDKLKDQITTGP